MMATVTPRSADQTVVEFDVRTDEMLVNMGPQHPWRAASRPADRWRGCLRGDAAPGLSAPLRREDRRERDAHPVHPVHRSHGLPGGDEHEPRLFARRRE